MNFEGKVIDLRSIVDLVIRYASMVIGHKVCIPKNDLLVSTIVVHTSVDMVKRGMDYDFCELLRIHLLKNLMEIKKSKKNTF